MTSLSPTPRLDYSRIEAHGLRRGPCFAAASRLTLRRAVQMCLVWPRYLTIPVPWVARSTSWLV